MILITITIQFHVLRRGRRMELTKIAFHVRDIPSHTPKQSFQHFAQTGSFPSSKKKEWRNSRPPHTKKLQNTHTQHSLTHSPKLGSTKVVPPVSVSVFVGTSKFHVYTKRVGMSCSEVKKKKKKI
jgi:hypothetical protein